MKRKTKNQYANSFYHKRRPGVGDGRVGRLGGVCRVGDTLFPLSILFVFGSVGEVLLILLFITFPEVRSKVFCSFGLHFRETSW